MALFNCGSDLGSTVSALCILFRAVNNQTHNRTAMMLLFTVSVVVNYFSWY